MENNVSKRSGLNNFLKLKDIATAQVGYQSRGKLDESHNGDFTILRPQDFDSMGRLNLESAARFFEYNDPDPRKYLITRGDILVQARGQQHCAFYIDQLIENTVASNSFYIIKEIDTSKIQSEFLAWWINQSIVQKYFEQEQGMSTVPFISLSALLDAPVVHPASETQETIGELWYCWQKEQELITQLIGKKEQFIQAVAMMAVNKIQEVENDR
jgi:restriction endonuclease S subunit